MAMAAMVALCTNSARAQSSDNSSMGTKAVMAVCGAPGPAQEHTDRRRTESRNHELLDACLKPYPIA
jgi:hypothetical protein